MANIASRKAVKTGPLYRAHLTTMQGGPAKSVGDLHGVQGPAYSFYSYYNSHRMYLVISGSAG